MRRLVAFGALAVALTACGNPDQQAGRSTVPVAPGSGSGTTAAAPPAPTPASTPAASTPQASGRCTAAVLAAEVQPGDSGAGNRYAKLVVTNNGPAPCTLSGYSGLQLLDASGQPVPTDLQRTPDPGPAPVVVPPKARAAANLHWTVVPTDAEPVDGPCQPEAARARAIPPDDTQPMSLEWGLGPVCGGGRIEISAFYAA
ncbi:DUF4232 domain-containing protein [Saccharothrix syringae]|uniref:DUF4232 domain-containing protein n=1 Tax=Saccharothrix syringae TaxID=103733 RepID=A0A5Q0GS97_SACSY|nr:DUF4232 domain-containing protein [Saccharothrix syringae]QFZ16545.1 DUF4232 domain-containing protein [Saccharothrix syringae]